MLVCKSQSQMTGEWTAFSSPRADVLRVSTGFFVRVIDMAVAWLNLTPPRQISTLPAVPYLPQQLLDNGGDVSCNRQLALVGLQLRIINGVVSLLTTEVHNRALAAYLSEQTRANASSGLTTATLEVLACIAFKQPISQTEIDRLFDADKRGLVVTLRDLKLVEEFAGADGRLRFATTEAFLHRFSLPSLEELTAGTFSDKATAIEPLI